VVPVLGIEVGHNHRIGRIVQPRLDVIEAEDAPDLGHEEIAPVKSHPVRGLQTLRDLPPLLGPAIAVRVAEGIHHSLAS